MRKKTNKLVILSEDEVVFTRTTRWKHRVGKHHYDPNLQDMLLIEGEDALRSVSLRYYDGFVRARPRT